MFKYQIKDIPKNMFSSLSLAWAYTSIIVFLLLDIESVEARLIWIPHGKDIKEDSPKSYHKTVATKREKMVRIGKISLKFLNKKYKCLWSMFGVLILLKLIFS